MSDYRKEHERQLAEAAAKIRRGEATNGIADARDRLRDAARNEATVLVLNRQNADLRARVAELTKQRDEINEACGDNYNTILELRRIVADQDAALAKREAAAVPEGFVMVPVEPTTDMLIAGVKANYGRDGVVGSIYSAMLAASQQAAPVVAAPFKPWPGGECPVSGDTLVDVKIERDDMRKSTLYARRADSLGHGWSLAHGSDPYVRAWRLADENTEQYRLISKGGAS